MSARAWQMRCGQWVHGKGFDTFCPLGPAMVTADEIPDPQALTLSTRQAPACQAPNTVWLIRSMVEGLSTASQKLTNSARGPVACCTM